MTDLYQQEYARAYAKYTPELWATLHPTDMLAALQREVNELARALWAGELEGEHGAEREAVHCQVVSQRIIDELRRRKEESNGLCVQKESAG